MAGRVLNLMRRSGTFYFRCRVPSDLQPQFGKREIKFSLGTSDYRAARRLAAMARCLALYDFSGARMTEREKPFIPVFSSEEIARLGRDKPYIFRGTEQEMMTLLTNRLRDTFGALSDVAAQRDVAGELAKKAEGEADQAKEEAVQAQRAVVKLVNDGVTGKGGSDGAAKLHPDSAQPFHVFIQPYYQAKGIVGQAKRNKDTTFKDFQAVVGDKPIREISRNDVIAFHDAGKAKDGRHGQQASYKTVNKKLSDLRVFFHWCLEQRNLIGDNPVRGYSADATKQEIREGKKPKRSFTSAELQAIFHSPLFSGCAAANRVHQPGSVKCRDHRFWFPVVALFTGLRLSELAELEFTDIVQLYNRTCFWVRRQSGYNNQKSVKNDASVRKVPIHPFLVEVGFGDFVEDRRKLADDGRIFPPYDYGKIFNETLLGRVLRIKTREISFHSFRHNFKDALRDATSDIEVRDRMCGHTAPGMDAEYGSGDLSAVQMATIDAVKFLVDLQHLKPQPDASPLPPTAPMPADNEGHDEEGKPDAPKAPVTRHASKERNPAKRS